MPTGIAVVTSPRDERKGRLVWPVVGELAEGYGIRVDPQYGTKTRNQGLDIVCQPGSQVRAVDDGKVSYADQFMGYGRTVIVDHGDRLHSIYSGLKEIRVSVGDGVKRGEIIGVSLDTLHFEVRKEGKSVDPKDWLGPK